MSDPYDNPYSSQESAQRALDIASMERAICAAIAEFRNILDRCATAPSRYEAAVDEIHRFAAHGLRALGAEML